MRAGGARPSFRTTARFGPSCLCQQGDLGMARRVLSALGAIGYDRSGPSSSIRNPACLYRNICTHTQVRFVLGPFLRNFGPPSRRVHESPGLELQPCVSDLQWRSTRNPFRSTYQIAATRANNSTNCKPTAHEGQISAHGLCELTTKYKNHSRHRDSSRLTTISWKRDLADHRFH